MHWRWLAKFEAVIFVEALALFMSGIQAIEFEYPVRAFDVDVVGCSDSVSRWEPASHLAKSRLHSIATFVRRAVLAGTVDYDTLETAFLICAVLILLAGE